MEDFIISSRISPRRFAFCQVTSLEGDVEEQWHAQHLDDMEMFQKLLISVFEYVLKVVPQFCQPPSTGGKT